MKKHFPIIAFVMVALATLATATFAYFASQEAARFKFEATADDALNRLESRIDLHISLLRATHGLFTARSGKISSEEFRAFFDALDIEKNYAGLRGLGFLAVAKSGEEAVLEDEIRRFHGIDRSIFPQSDQDMRTPVVLFEPLDRTRLSGIGLDMFADPTRRAAIQAAIETGQPRASERVILGQQTSAQQFPGFLIFYSLDLPAPPGAVSLDRKTAGILYAAIRTEDLFKVAFDKFPILPINAEVFAGDVAEDKQLFKSSFPPGDAFGAEFLVTRKMIVAGQPWILQFRPTADFLPPSARGVPIMLGLLGLLLAGAIASAARYQDRAYDAAAQLHDQMEKSLIEKDLMLQEMKHRIKNSITRVLAIARQTASGSKDISEFSSSFSARLQAMAASQDMLTRSRWQKADLAELLRIELGQVFGKELPDDMLSGPKVLLSETETQALGLTFHELATNALKYGEAGNSVEALKVSWTHVRKGQRRRLVLTWREVGEKPIEPPAKTGFGTRLIDMNITRELGGAIVRDYHSDGLIIEIDIPLSRKTREA